MSSTEARRLRLACVGDNCIDVLHYTAEGRTVRRVGGNAVNVAVQAARQGAEVRYLGAVGVDPDGELTRRVLVERGVGTEGLVQRPAPTSVTEIEVGPDGERSILREDFGACQGYAPSPADRETLLEADHVHLGWLDDGGRLRRWLAERGRSVSQDLSVNAAPEDLGVEGLTVAFGSLAGSSGLAESLGCDWLARGARIAVVTRGAEGATVVTKGGLWHVPAEPVVPVDTTGAGDAFIAGFLLSHLAGAPPVLAAREGARLGRLACLHEGGFPQLDHVA